MSEPFFDIALRAPLAHFELDYRMASAERFVGVFGPSGAGKTSVIELIAGWRRPRGGHVRVGGRTLFDAAAGVSVPTRRRGIGYVPQDVLLFPHWNVLRNVTASSRGAGSRARRAALVERVLAALELERHVERPVGLLSGGEQRRVALARALLQPDLLLLDEPLASLDVPLRRRILGDLLKIREEFRVPMLLISHDATEVEVLCDHAQLLERGRVRAEGRPSALLDGPTDYENVVRGRVLAVDHGAARVALEGGPELVLPRSGVAAGERVVLGVRADEVLVALARPEAISARNVLPARVESIRRGGEHVALRVLIGELPLVVHVTEDAVRELGLAEGRDVHLILKSRSVQVIASRR